MSDKPSSVTAVPLQTLLESFEKAALFPSFRIQSSDIEIIVASLRAAIERERAA